MGMYKGLEHPVFSAAVSIGVASPDAKEIMYQNVVDEYLFDRGMGEFYDVPGSRDAASVKIDLIRALDRLDSDIGINNIGFEKIKDLAENLHTSDGLKNALAVLAQGDKELDIDFLVRHVETEPRIASVIFISIAEGKYDSFERVAQDMYLKMAFADALSGKKIAPADNPEFLIQQFAVDVKSESSIGALIKGATGVTVRDVQNVIKFNPDFAASKFESVPHRGNIEEFNDLLGTLKKEAYLIDSGYKTVYDTEAQKFLVEPIASGE